MKSTNEAVAEPTHQVEGRELRRETTVGAMEGEIVINRSHSTHENPCTQEPIVVVCTFVLGHVHM